MLLGNDVLQQLLNCIREAVLADETADISNQEQLSLSIRWVSKSYEINEDFIGLVHVPNITASVLTEAIKDVLIRCSLPLVQCRGQAYDGAANMMGHLRGVATQIQLPGTGLRPLCPTRWTVSNVAIDSVIKNYPALLEAFERISNESHYGRRTNGVLTMLEKFSVYFGLKLSFLVFSATEQVSRALQAQNTTVQEALSAVKMAEAFFQRHRDDCTFDRVYVTAENEAKQYNIEQPVLPCYRRPPRRLDDGASPHVYSTPQEYYR